MNSEITTRKGYQRRLKISGHPALVGKPTWKVVGGKGQLKVAPDGMSAILTDAIRCVVEVTGDTQTAVGCE